MGRLLTNEAPRSLLRGASLKIQYTIWRIPEALDEKIRAVAEEGPKSLNTLIIETLEKQFLHVSQSSKNTDLNQFSGLWVEDPEFDQAIAAFDEIDDTSQRFMDCRVSPAKRCNSSNVRQSF